MKFKLVNRLLEELLYEDIEAVKKNFPNIPENKFMQLIALDPTYNPERNSVGTYGKWILNLFNKGRLDNEGHVKDALSRFEENKKYLLNKDINSFKSLDDLDNYLNDDSNYKEKSHSQEVRDRQKDRKNADLDKEATKVFSGDGFDVWVPHTYAASCKLGQGTRWCTASTESDYYYNRYKDEYGGEYYILINQSNPEEKYQFHFESRQFMDADDYSINLGGFFRKHMSLDEFFENLILGTQKEIKVDFSPGQVYTLSDWTEADVTGYMDLKGISLEECMNILQDPYAVVKNPVVFGGELESACWRLNTSNEEILKNLGIPSIKDFLSKEDGSLWYVNRSLAEQIQDVLLFAYKNSKCAYQVDILFEKINQSLDRCHAKPCWYGRGDIGLMFTFDRDTAWDLYCDLSGHCYGESLEELLAESCLDKHFFVPSVSYIDGFDKEVFNDVLSERLREIS